MNNADQKTKFPLLTTGDLNLFAYRDLSPEKKEEAKKWLKINGTQQQQDDFDMFTKIIINGKVNSDVCNKMSEQEKEIARAWLEKYGSLEQQSNFRKILADSQAPSMTPSLRLRTNMAQAPDGHGESPRNKRRKPGGGCTIS